jgi:hypothetical protein
MAREYLPCEKCGRKSKRIFFVRGPVRLGFTVVGLGCLGAVKVLGIADTGLSPIVLYIAALLVTLPLISLLRIRCLHCEP